MLLWCLFGKLPNQRRRSTFKIDTRATHIFACHFPPGYRLLRFRNLSVVCENVCFLHTLRGGLTGKYHYFSVFYCQIRSFAVSYKIWYPLNHTWIIGVRPSGPALRAVCVCEGGCDTCPGPVAVRELESSVGKLATLGVCRCCKIHCLMCIYTTT